MEKMYYYPNIMFASLRTCLSLHACRPSEMYWAMISSCCGLRAANECPVIQLRHRVLIQTALLSHVHRKGSHCARHTSYSAALHDPRITHFVDTWTLVVCSIDPRDKEDFSGEPMCAIHGPFIIGTRWRIHIGPRKLTTTLVNYPYAFNSKPYSSIV